jgi:hypothetical protein
MSSIFLKFISALTLFISTPSFAHKDHDHHEGWPENTLLALEGQDAITKETCFLFVTDIGYTGPEQTQEQFFAVVQTNYAHGSDKPSPFIVRAVPNKPGVLAGTGASSQDQIALFLDPQDLDLRNVKSYNLKWLHGNHFHMNRCMNLSVHTHEGEDH